MASYDSDKVALIHQDLHSHLPPEPALRAKALESLLVEKDVLKTDAVDKWIRDFAAAAVDLQEKRHAADYDVMRLMNLSNAILAIGNARTALARFHRADQSQREAFLSLLMFKPRQSADP